MADTDHSLQLGSECRNGVSFLKGNVSLVSRIWFCEGFETTGNLNLNMYVCVLLHFPERKIMLGNPWTVLH